MCHKRLLLSKSTVHLPMQDPDKAVAKDPDLDVEEAQHWFKHLPPSTPTPLPNPAHLPCRILTRLLQRTPI